MFISEIFNLPKGHKDLDFVDIKFPGDTQLFIDPCLIEVGNSEFCKSANITVQDFIDFMFTLYKNCAPLEDLLQFFEHMHEINYTRLGYGNGENGKAKTAQGMVDTLSDLRRLFGLNIGIKYPIDIPIFIKDFAEDCLSDMLTNVLFLELNNFTLSQCKKYGIKTRDCEEECYYWDINSHSWQRYKGKCLYVKGKMVLLVPKEILCKRYYYRTEQFFSSVILERIQQEKTCYDEKGVLFKPTKKSIKKQLLNTSEDIRLVTISQTAEAPGLLDVYHGRMENIYCSRQLTDDDFDEFIYEKDHI